MNQAFDYAESAQCQASIQSSFEPTFRDPAGQLRLTQSHAFRLVRPAAAAQARAFLESALRADLERSGDLVSTDLAEPGALSCMQPGELWLQHPLIEPISYPWEWTAAQWRSAAELTLRVADRAIDAGWILKDATPLNVVFSGARPVLVDVPSLEQRDPSSGQWLAYGQFVRTFLLPLVARKLLGWPLQATLFHRDGYEPRTLYYALTVWQRMRPDLFDVVTLATLLENKKSNSGAGEGNSPRWSADLAAHILHKRIARLRRQIHRAALPEESSQWKSYTQSAAHYGPADTEEKERFVRAMIARCRPSNVLDIGANTGAYSRIAAESSAQVVALDSDAAALTTLWRTAFQAHQPITALLANIARPTPAAGWLNREHFSLLSRLAGRFDLVMMLAVIHHLILREQLPLAHIASLCASLTRRWLIVEWVPPADPMYQEWLRGREELYGHFSQEDLLAAFSSCFTLVESKLLGNQRSVLLFERRDTRSDPCQPSRPC